MGRQLTKYNPETLEAARQLYLRYTPWKDIEEKTGVIVRDIKRYSHNKWRHDRQALKSELIETALESKKHLLMSIGKCGLEITSEALNKLLEEIREGRRLLTPTEIKSISQVVSSFDTIVKLDDGQATERKEIIKPASIIEIKKMINDPFLEIEDASFKEVEDKTDDK